MKIVRFNAENFKRLRAVEITPAGDVVQVTGRNEQGKSSILDAIWAALAGADALPDMPIRSGEHTARIRLDLGDIIVTRKFEEGRDSQLVVESAEGARFGSPQKMLDTMLGALSFDPLEFAGMKPVEQFEELRKIARLDVDIDKLDGLNKRDYDDRTTIARDAKAKRAQADGITVRPGLPEQRIDTATLMQAITDAAKINADIETRKGRRSEAERNIADKRTAANNHRELAAEYRHKAEECDTEAKSLDAAADELAKRLEEAPALPEPVDVDAKRKEFEQAEAINREIERRDRKRAIIEEAEGLEAQVKDLSDSIDARKAEKAAAIAKAKMPVEGLTFGEDKTVVYRGVPFQQASTAVQIRVSLAIAMAANPKIRVIRIKEGSLLDDENLALVADMAKAGDYQVWIERVDSSGKVGVAIEDGSVKAIDGAPPPPPKEEPKAAKRKASAKAPEGATSAAPAKEPKQEPLL